MSEKSTGVVDRVAEVWRALRAATFATDDACLAAATKIVLAEMKAKAEKDREARTYDPLEGMY